MSIESNPFDCENMEDDLIQLTSGDLNDVLGNED
jgi:hypothetical protein